MLPTPLPLKQSNTTQPKALLQIFALFPEGAFWAQARPAPPTRPGAGSAAGRCPRSPCCRPPCTCPLRAPAPGHSHPEAEGSGCYWHCRSRDRLQELRVRLVPHRSVPAGREEGEARGQSARGLLGAQAAQWAAALLSCGVGSGWRRGEGAVGPLRSARDRSSWVVAGGALVGPVPSAPFPFPFLVLFPFRAALPVGWCRRPGRDGSAQGL